MTDTPVDAGGPRVSPRQLGEMMARLGHLGQEGRRPRMLEGWVTAVDPVTGTCTASIMGGTPVPDLVVAAGFAGGRLPDIDERVRIEAVQYSHVVVDTYVGG